MKWKMRLTQPNEPDGYVIYFEDEKELGIFLQNFDRDKFRIKSIYPTKTIDKLTDGQELMKKNKNLETGENK